MKIEEVQIRKINTGKVIAQAKVNFGWFWLSGFKVVASEDGKTYVTPPSYKSGFGWKSLFTTIKKSDWVMIHDRIIEEFNDLEIKETLDKESM